MDHDTQQKFFESFVSLWSLMDGVQYTGMQVQVWFSSCEKT